MSLTCPLCLLSTTTLFQIVDEKEYYSCATCQCTFLKPAHYLTPDEEKAHYQCHQNTPTDTGYRHFLSKLSTPLREHLKPGIYGLDYGCGPGPTLSKMLEEAGHMMNLYDPFFYPNRTTLKQKYDFITCTEVVEHFQKPAQEFETFAKLLRPGGIVGIMTSFLVDEQDFATWPYRLDPTHVIFYREKTFHYLAEKYLWKIYIPYKDVVIFQLP